MAKARTKIIKTGVMDIFAGWAETDGAAIAQATAAAARAAAPVRTGRYRDSIHVEAGTGWDGRPVLRVVADAPNAILVESRTGNLAAATPPGDAK